MTPAEHAKMWRKVAEQYRQRGKTGDNETAFFCDAMATAYEQSAKEQEGTTKVKL